MTVATAEPGTFTGSPLPGDSSTVYRRTSPVPIPVRDTLANKELAKVLVLGLLPSRATRSSLPSSPPAVACGGFPFLPKERLLSREEKSAAADAFTRVLESCEFTSGSRRHRLRACCRRLPGPARASLTGAGTVVIALRAGGPDQAIMPANSFAATENAASRCRARARGRDPAPNEPGGSRPLRPRGRPSRPSVVADMAGLRALSRTAGCGSSRTPARHSG
ncbi:putative NTD biosynthesis operon protein NtdA [Streptomyces afghaniensis 772] [Streptomyces afghaniensis]